jgi:hypothetical protein
MWQGITNKMEQKNKKYFSECFRVTLGEETLPRVSGKGTRGRGHLPRVLEHGTRGRHFSFFCKRFRLKASSNANFLLWVPLFLECCTRGWRLSPSVTLGKASLPPVHFSPSATLGEDWLPRVPDFWHSGNFGSPVVIYWSTWSMHSGTRGISDSLQCRPSKISCGCYILLGCLCNHAEPAEAETGIIVKVPIRLHNTPSVLIYLTFISSNLS